MHNRIPLARGLGSSAAATVGGLRGRQRAARRSRSAHATCSRSRPRSRATRTTPPRRCSAGSSCRRLIDDGVEAIRFDAPRDLRAVLFIPDLRLSTAAMREALPEKVPLADAVANLGAVATRRGRAGHGPVRPAAAADRRPAPRAVSGERLPAAPRAGRGGPRGRRARGLPVRAPARRSSPSRTR